MFEKGKFEIVRRGGMTIGRATYLPGWKWSQHVAPNVGKNHCEIEHVGLVVSGCATAANRGPRSDRHERGRPVLRPSRPAWTRQLGSRRRAVRVGAFSGCQRLRNPEALIWPDICQEGK